ncbi:MAG: efflux RND transporter periplasmic adaptor subunit [Magnetococcales bacterium]|nr:efflux RND transporter periplasmic adaptor subunit [Magnetococcales bacterium]
MAATLAVAWAFAQPTAPLAAPVPAYAPNYNVITVTTAKVGADTTLGGTVVPFREVTFSAQLPGRVKYLAGVEGDWFKEGTVLLAIDDDDLLAKRKALFAAKAQASAEMRNAWVQYRRQVQSGSDMAESSGMAAPKMMDDYMTKPLQNMMGSTGMGTSNNPELTRRSQIFAQGTRIEQARSQLAQTEAQIQELDTKIRDAKSVSPFSGVIVRKHVERGDTVQPGMPLLAFADTRNLQIKVDVPARLMPGLRKGMTIPAKLDVGNARIETRVAQIYPMADTQRHTVTVKLDMPQDVPGGPGMYAEVMIPDITTPMEDLPVIPVASVVQNGSLPGVYVLGANNQPELRMVRLGRDVDAATVSVLSGLRAGERILASPPAGMAPDWKTPAQVPTPAPVTVPKGGA